MYTQAQIEEFHLMSELNAARRIAERDRKVEAKKFLATPVTHTGWDELIELPKRRPLVQISDFDYVDGREDA